MNIAILGAGKVGLAVGAALARAGHAVTYGVRTPGEPGQAPLAEAAAACEAAIIAVPFGAVAAIAPEIAAPLAGKPVLDLTNPLGMVDGALGLTMGHATSGAEQIAALLPGVHLVKAFNQTGVENLGNAAAYATRPVMFAAGDDPAARALATRLMQDAGFDAHEFGPLRNARLLEPFAMLWIELARNAGRTPDFAFALIRKS